jgi:lactate dehydrogenase-like 2-hydroxyacid dehydrogenase
MPVFGKYLTGWAYILQRGLMCYTAGRDTLQFDRMETAMTQPAMLAIGTYSAENQAAFQAAFDVTALATIAELPRIDAPRRSAIRGVAYKGHAPFDGAQMDALPNLEVIANYGVGYDAIDVDAAAARGVRVTNTPDVLNDDVADLAVAMLLAFDRNILANASWLARGDWATKGDPPIARKFSGRRAGIMGLGRIGREIANRMAAFKMEIHYHSRTAKDTPEGWVWHATPQGLAANCDYMVVALVGGSATTGYVSRDVIAALGPDAVIANISRGSTVDESALIEALAAGRIRGAALDVFSAEPQLDPRFLALPNVILQPHQGSATVETRAAMADLQRANLCAHFAGQPLLTPVV